MMLLLSPRRSCDGEWRPFWLKSSWSSMEIEGRAWMRGIVPGQHWLAGFFLLAADVFLMVHINLKLVRQTQNYRCRGICHIYSSFGGEIMVFRSDPAPLKHRTTTSSGSARLGSHAEMRRNPRPPMRGVQISGEGHGAGALRSHDLMYTLRTVPGTGGGHGTPVPEKFKSGHLPSTSVPASALRPSTETASDMDVSLDAEEVEVLHGLLASPS